MNTKHVAGKKAGKFMLYALSTCVWCQKTKKLLNDLGIEYEYLDVDTLAGSEKEATMNTVRKYNPACSFPTLVIDDKICIVGFKEDDIRQAVKS
ncbi:MAG: NrdH-redoxin [Chloroflexi bacterium RBG_16_50_9]|nr:MAG: NrdH-redoxin [Chloroflexi bacterium RBG_16_50_9]